MIGKPTKLRDGNWGATVEGTPVTGDTVTITARSGKSWTARITRVVWKNGKIAICATESMDRPATSAAPNRRRKSINNECDYCADGISFGMRPGSICSHCGGQVN